MQAKVKWAVAVGVLALAAGQASANHGWGNYHWPLPGTNQRFDVLVGVDRPHWEIWVDAAIADWDGSDPDASGYTDYLNPVRTGAYTGSRRKCDPVAGKIAVCSDSYGQRGWLGIATIWASGDHITQATTKLNNSYHDSGAYSSDAWRQLVACQEIGHDFGLGHQNEDFSTDETDSCMEYTSDETNNRTPDAHDYEHLQTIYNAHAAETGGGGGGGGGGDCNPRSPKCNAGQDAFTFREVGKGTASSSNGVSSDDWGEAVGYDAHGRPNVFVQQVRQGFRKITHVTWVPGFRPQARHMHDEH